MYGLQTIDVMYSAEYGELDRLFIASFPPTWSIGGFECLTFEILSDDSREVQQLIGLNKRLGDPSIRINSWYTEEVLFVAPVPRETPLPQLIALLAHMQSVLAIRVLRDKGQASL